MAFGFRDVIDLANDFAERAIFRWQDLKDTDRLLRQIQWLVFENADGLPPCSLREGPRHDSHCYIVKEPSIMLKRVWIHVRLGGSQLNFKGFGPSEGFTLRSYQTANQRRPLFLVWKTVGRQSALSE